MEGFLNMSQEASCLPMYGVDAFVIGSALCIFK